MLKTLFQKKFSVYILNDESNAMQINKQALGMKE